MIRTKGFMAVAGIVMAASVAGCDRSDDSDPIRIGAIFATTGVGQVYGSPSLLGTQLAVDQINAEGGLLGRQLEVIHRDHQSDPAVATSSARDLISRYDVNFLIGGVTSATGQAISQVARQERVVYLAPLAKTIELTAPANFHPYVFRVATNTIYEGKAAAVIADRLGLDSMCTLLLDYSYGYSLDESFSQHYTAIRPQGRFVYQARPPLGESDYTTYITSILNSGCDGVFANLWGSHFPGFAKQAATFGFFERVRYISAGEIGSPEISAELGPDYPDGVWGNSYELFYYPDTPEHNEYLQALRERTGTDHTPSFPITGYVAVQFLAEAIRQAGSTDSDAVAEALRGLTINTPVGQMTMREDQQANRGEFWGEMNPSNVAGYSHHVMNPVEYIPGDDLMDY